MRTSPLAATLAAALFIAGCAQTLDRKTPAELIASPGTQSTLATQTAYDEAYRILLESFKACYQRPLTLFGSAQMNVITDKTPTDARLSLQLSSWANTKVLYTTTLTPASDGTRIGIYSAGTTPSDTLAKAIRHWLAGGTGCPGDQGFGEKG